MASTTDIDALLDTGSGGLVFFRTLFARYRAATGRYPAGCPAPDPSRTHTCMDDAYFMQCGLSLAKLEALSRALGGDRFDGPAAEQGRVLGMLDRTWHGPAADSAKETICSLLRRSSPTGGDIAQLPSLIRHVIEGITGCVSRKADAFRELDGVHVINGVNMLAPHGDAEGDDVSIIIRYWRHREVESSGRDRLAELFPTAARSIIGDGLQSECAAWVDHFLPAVEGYAGAYYDLCASTDAIIRRYLATVADALSDIRRAASGIESVRVIAEAGHFPRIPPKPSGATGDPKQITGTGAILTEPGPM